MYFTQQAQHHKWLLERRAEAFAKFLQMIEEARRSMSDTIYDRQLEEQEKNLRLSELCLPVMTYVRIVRLYLPSDTRDEFYERAKDYVDRYSTFDLGDTRLRKVNEDMDKIQEIFERELSAYFWARPVKSRLKQIARRLRQRKKPSKQFGEIK